MKLATKRKPDHDDIQVSRLVKSCSLLSTLDIRCLDQLGHRVLKSLSTSNCAQNIYFLGHLCRLT